MIATEVTDTQRVIAEMLTENTGTHFLDSGGAYGRSWERNQGKTVEDFIDGPDAWCSGYQCVTVDVFHWLTNRLAFNVEIDEEFNDFMNSQEDTYYLEDMEAFAKIKAGNDWDKDYCTGSFNSYNGEEALSQTIQFVMYVDSETDESVVLLQIHGGADVRGGYTKPRAFTVDDDRAYMFDWCSFTYYCTREPDAPAQNESLFDIPVNLERHYYDIRNATDVSDWTGSYIANFEVEDDEDRNPLCPECGGVMEVSANNNW